MTQLPKPQQQLKSYFNDLLATLDDPDENAIETPNSKLASETDEPVVSDTATHVTHDIVEDSSTEPPMPAPTAPVTTVQEQAAPASSVATKESTPTSILKSANPLAVNAPVLPSVDQAVKPLAKLSKRNAEVTSTVAVDDELSAHEFQKQKLQKLLITLAPPVAKVDAETATDVSVVDVDIAETDSKTVTGLAPSLTPNSAPELDTNVISNVSETLIDSFAPLSSEWLDNGRPCWAEERFDILILTVAGLKLAVPLAALGQIHPLKDKDDLTPLFGQAEWFMGLQKTQYGNVKTVNTAQFVMPERYKPEDIEQYGYVVAINGLGWGIAVDEVNQPISIQPDEVRWRKQRHERRWMAGTVKEHMCVLIDIPVLGEMLNGSDSNSPR